MIGEPDILQRFKDRFNELMVEGGDFRTITFAEAQLEAKGLPASEKWHVVESAVWAVVKKGEKDEKKLPREADLATLEAFRTYFHALIVSEIEALPPDLPLQQMKKKARKVIEIMQRFQEEGFSFGFNRESVLWLEYHIEELRQAGRLRMQQEERSALTFMAHFWVSASSSITAAPGSRARGFGVLLSMSGVLFFHLLRLKTRSNTDPIRVLNDSSAPFPKVSVWNPSVLKRIPASSLFGLFWTSSECCGPRQATDIRSHAGLAFRSSLSN